MVVMVTDSRMFPPAQSKHAEWAPVYLEPMHGSGERFVALVVASDADGAFHVETTLRPKVLQCMYGDRAEVIASLVELVEEALQDHFAFGGSLQNWSSPLSSFVLGPVRNAIGPDLMGVALRGASLTASLAAVLAEEPQATEVVAVAPDVDRWLQQIRASLKMRTDSLDARFNGEVRVRDGASPTRIGYLGDRIAANFDALVPGPALSTRRVRSKARLVDLQILRDQVDQVFKRSSYELMLWMPEANSPAFSQRYLDGAKAALAELEEFGDKHDLRVRPLHSADAAAAHILSYEIGAA